MAKTYITITSEPEWHEGKKEWSFRFRIPAINGDKPYKETWQKTGTKKKSEAKRQAEEHRRELEEKINSWERWKGITLGQYARNWHEGRIDDVAISTWKKDNQQIKQIEQSELGNLPIDEIEPEDIEKQLKQNIKNGFTVDMNRRYLKKVKLIMKTAALRRTIKHDPSAVIKNIKDEKRKREAISHGDIVQMMKVLENEEKTGYTTALYIAIGTGFRRGEILGLQWKDIDFNRNRINLVRQYTPEHTLEKPKWNSVGVIPMTWELREWLFQWRTQSTGFKGKGTARRGMIFANSPVCTNKDGGYIDPNNFGRWCRDFFEKNEWGRLGDDGEFHRYTLHQIRHYMATQLLGNGADLQTVRSLMRHKSITTTEGYLHEIDENLYYAMNELARKQQGLNSGGITSLEEMRTVLPTM